MSTAFGPALPELGSAANLDPLWVNLIEHSMVGIALTDPAGRWIHVNATLCAMLGCARSACVGKSIQDLIAPAEREAFAARLERLRDVPATSLRADCRHVRDDGSTLHGSMQIAAFGAAAGEAPLGYTVQVTDLSALKQAETALEDAKRGWDQTLSGSRQVVWDFHVPTGMVEVSSQWQAMLDLPHPERVHHISQWLDKMHPDDRERLFEATERVRLSGESEFDAFYRLRHHTQDRWIWVLSRGKVVEYAADGSIVRMIGTIIDITHEKELEARLTTLTERLEIALQVGHIGIFELDLATRRLTWDERTYELHGVTPEAFDHTPEGFFGLLHPDDLAKVMQARELAYRQASNYQADYRVRHQASGRDRHLRMSVRLVRAADGSVERAVGACWDITDDVAQTRRLQETLALLEGVLQGTPDLIYVKDRAGRYLLVNPAVEHIMGRPASSIIGHLDTDIFPPDTAKALIDNDRQVFESGSPYTIEETAVVDGVQRIYSSIKAPLRDSQGRLIGILGISRDQTEAKKAEIDLRRSEARWQFALDGSGDGIWDWDMQTGHVFYSRQWKAMLGHAGDEIGPAVGEWSSRVHPDDLQRCWTIIEDHLAGRTADFVLEHRMRTKHNDWCWILDRGKVIERAPDGQPLRVIGTHTDITERKESEAAILALNERLRLALGVSGVGIWELLDVAEGSFIWDEPMHRLYGVAPGSFSGRLKDWLDRIHPDDVAPVLDTWQDTLADPQATSFDSEFRILWPDGEVRHMRAQAQIFRDGDGAPRRAIGVNRDITDECRAAEALRQAKEAAESAERAKSEFLAVMSHEIRTPMNTVLGMTRLALQTELAPKQRGYLGKVNASAQKLITIINNVLDYSKIEAGGLVLEEAPFTLTSVLESVAAVTAIKAEEKGLEIAYATAPGVPDQLVGDALRLGQILINLVNNAIKFTPQGEVIVAVSLARRIDEGHVVLAFEVRDTGIGLAEDQVARLFHAFNQAESDTSRKYGGTGLGLAICKRLVERMGGDISVASQPGRGSVFRFTVAVGQAREQPPSRWARKRANLAGRRVLITDDNASARDIFSRMLRDFGMDVLTAHTGQGALEALRKAAREQRPFELVLMDWRMPGMDGLETARRIREDRALQLTPAVLMVTAYCREEVVRQVEQLQLQGLLVKPITESTLFETIENLFSRDSADDAESDVPATRAAWEETPLAADLLARCRGRRVLVVDDNALNREVASEFLKAAGFAVDVAGDGEGALARLREHGYDAVLLDVHMPGMDGLATARAIRRNERWAGLPIIALTALARSEDRAASMDAGMNAHLTKPLDATVLYETLSTVLPAEPLPHHAEPAGGAAANDTAKAARPGDDPVLAVTATLDLPAALAHIGGKREVLIQLMRSFVADFGDALARLDDYLGSRRMKAVGNLVHAIRGSSAYFHALPLVDAAELLENAAWQDDGEGIRRYKPAFVQAFATVMDDLREVIARLPAEEAPVASGDAGRLDVLLERAEPLIRRGDYAAEPLLREIEAGLAQTPSAAAAAALRIQFDQLDLAEAIASVHHLREAIMASRRQGA